MTTAKSELEAWEASADHWIRNADRLAAMTAAASEALIARLAPAPGQRLLDIAAGAGDPTLQLALLVGPTGHVTATDGVPQMVESLQRRAQARGLRHVSTRVVSAEQLDVPAASFDGACCRFGAMFFADPPLALANMARAVRPGGRLVVVVWGEREANPFFTLTLDALDDAGGPPASLPPGTRTVFEYASSGLLLGLAREAGWTEVREERSPFTITLPDTTPDTVLDVLTDLSRKVSDRVQTLQPAQVDTARRLVTERARRYARGRDIVFPAEVLLVSGRARA